MAAPVPLRSDFDAPTLRRSLLATIQASEAAGKRIEIWFQDEARIGQKNKLTRLWARRGTRPSAPLDQRTRSGWLFGAICPAEGKGAALVLPRCSTEGRALRLEEISRAVLPLDQAGWHTSAKLKLPANITLGPLPPKSPELDPVENVWPFMRENWLSNRVFESYRDIVDHRCSVRNTLVAQPWIIMSIGMPDWAHGC